MPKRILIIDDDEDILEILNIVFQDDGFDVIISNTGATAENLEIIHPDAVLLDIHIVGYKKRGNEICAEIRKRYPLEKLPVLLISAEPDIVELAESCGANGFIKKPFDIAQVSQMVKQLIPIE